MAKCTSCGHPNAYVSLQWVECPEQKCRFYPRTLNLPRHLQRRVEELWTRYRRSCDFDERWALELAVSAIWNEWESRNRP